MRAHSPTPRSALSPFDPAAGFVETVLELGGRLVHAERVRKALLRGGVQRWENLTVPQAPLPRGLLAGLADRGFTPLTTAVVAESRDFSGSVKLGLALRDGQVIECVAMPGSRGASVCVSTQVGCAMACRFCASGIGGRVRNLDCAEIVEQFAHAHRRLRLHRAVIMGIGEPLQNMEALLPALDRVCADLPLDPRRITISTLGHPAWIERLARHGMPFSLAVSLHAASDSLRQELVPTTKAPVREVVRAARDYARHFGGRVQFEVVVLAGVNDRDADLDALANLLRDEPAFVNFIAWNPVEGMSWQRPSEERMAALVRGLGARGVFATARTSLGGGVDAACGQLRRRLASSTAAD